MKNSLTRRDFLAAATAAGLGIGGNVSAEGNKQRKKPNIIFVFADQMRAQALGCYGNTIVPTPNFDAMAKAGMIFDNNISSWPVCSPFRAMLLTGLYPMANGVVHNDTGLKDGLPSIATACKDQGYATGYIGKWHLEWNRNPFVPKARRQGFDYWAVRNCSHNYLNTFYCGDTSKQVPVKGYEPLAQTDLAIDFMKKNREKPFCLFLSWGPPHDPYGAVPSKYKDRIPRNEIQLRKNVSEKTLVNFLLKERNATRSGDGARFKRDLQGYYAHTTALDDCIGKIRQAIRELGLAEDTMLVFSSDHGDMLGCHQMVSKQNPLEESIRTPLIVEYPRRVPAGARTDALCSPIDLMPTLLSLAELRCPKVDGKDLAAAARGGASDQQDAVLIMKLLPGGKPDKENGMRPWRGVRTKRYTYVNLLDHGPWLLFDNQKDPYQLNNLIENPDYAELRVRLEKRMRELMKEAGDPGTVSAIQDYRLQRMKKAGLTPRKLGKQSKTDGY